jgi:hypothetical protein
MATTWPSAFNAFDDAQFRLREHARENVRAPAPLALNAAFFQTSAMSSPSKVRRSPWKPVCLAMAAVVSGIVPGDDLHVDPRIFELAEHLADVGFRRIVEGDQAQVSRSRNPLGLSG